MSRFTDILHHGQDETDHVLRRNRPSFRDVSFTIIGEAVGDGVNIHELHFYDYSSLSRFFISKGDRRQKKSTIPLPPPSRTHTLSHTHTCTHTRTHNLSYLPYYLKCHIKRNSTFRYKAKRTISSVYITPKVWL